jgi:hypothetical protein
MINLVCFLGGLQLMMLGVLGEYIGRIYDEVKSRPLYLVAERHGLAPAVPMEEVAGVPPVGVGSDP